MATRRRRAAASARATLEQVVREADAGWPSGLTVLTGGDLFHLDRAQRVLLEALAPPEVSEFGLTVYGDQHVDVATVVAAARSAGMFSEHRVVLVRDVGALEGEPAALVAYAADPPPSSHLIVRAPELDRRRKLHQALVKSGRLLEFEPREPRAAGRMGPELAELGRRKGLEIDGPAAAMLAEICAGDFYRIDGELEKLRAWAGSEGRPITTEVLREVAAGSAALSGWEVARALVGRDRAAALAAVHRLLRAGDEPLRMLGGVAYRARAMLQARAMIERGVPPGRAVAAAGFWSQDAARAGEGIAHYSLQQVLGFPALLLAADRTLKSRGIAPAAVLGRMIERMIPDAGRRREGRR